jgi:hypothetical protein
LLASSAFVGEFCDVSHFAACDDTPVETLIMLVALFIICVGLYTSVKEKFILE